MERTIEVPIQLKLTDYKMVSQFLKNELGFNRTTVNNILQKLISDKNIDDMIIRKLESYTNRRQNGGMFTYELEKRINQRIDEHVNAIIDAETKATIERITRERIEAKLQDISL